MKNISRKNEDIRIILFLCNWGPHAAFQSLQDERYQIPPEIKMVRIPCAGTISKALLFKPFEMGADGVGLVGCEPGTCRYGAGTETSQRNVEDTRGFLELLGLGKDRLRLATFMPEESGALYQFLESFTGAIKNIGKSPVSAPAKSEASVKLDEMVAQTIRDHDIYACQDCGKCSSACSLALSGKEFSPRAIANKVIMGDVESASLESDVWSCLTCGLCYDRCPSAVNFPEFIQDMRHALRLAGGKGKDVHGGFFQSLMRTMTSGNLSIRHWSWLPEDVQLDPGSNILFFGGCAPYFDIFFRKHLKVQTNRILVDSIRLLNFFDIYPAVLEQERCCGHDLLWSGDKENTIKLAELNLEAFHKAGIEEVITACPECYRTLAHDYPKLGIEMDVKVTHIYDRLEEEIDKGAVKFKKLKQRITFQDPCRLSRFENRPDLPRKLIGRLQSAGFNEMQDRGAGAICCGNVAWTGCDAYSKALQVKRLRQAHDTGSDLLVTACPKCQIHLRCAMEDPFLGDELKMDMMDLTSILAKTIQWE
ncbi:MAG: hydrogenase iron-sulfur subunit [Deltaproteobacteria bacterium]|nr:hydrogenase iron-sulfur subunit [Deltaproteobacteria bacterium]